MAGKTTTVNVKGGGTATITTNSDGSRSVSFSNNVGGGYGGSTVTASKGGSSGSSGTTWTKTNSDGTTQTGNASGSGKDFSVSWSGSSNNGSGGGSNNNPGYTPVSQVDFGGLEFGQGASDTTQNSRNDMLGRYYAGRENSTADTIRQDLMQNSNFASASATDQQNTINKIMNISNQYKNGGGSGSGDLKDSLDGKDKLFPDYDVNNLKDKYNIDLSGVQGYLNQMNGDLSGLKNLVTQSNSMFLSKLDAQMTQQKAMEDKFNTEWSKIEGQMDENTRAQKERLDQMEQTYNANLAKMQDMLEDYYTGTMDALEAKKAGESAAAASDLSGKGLNQAVVANTQAGLDKNYREQFNSLMQANIELGQQLNNDYADFMQQIFNNHATLDSNQIKFLQDGLKMKQEYRQKETDLVNSYVDNVYAPLENYYNTLTNTYTEEANTAYTKERQVAEYKAMSDDAKEKAIFDRLVSMVGTDIESLSNWDLNLIEQVAANKNITNISQAIAAIIKGAGANSSSDIYNTVKTSVSNGTWNANPDNTNDIEDNTIEDNTTEDKIDNNEGLKSMYPGLNYDLNSINISTELNKILQSGEPAANIQRKLNSIAIKLNEDIKTIQKNTNPGSVELSKLITAYKKALNTVDDYKNKAVNLSSYKIGYTEGADSISSQFISDAAVGNQKSIINDYINKNGISLSKGKGIVNATLNNAKKQITKYMDSNSAALKELDNYYNSNKNVLSATDKANISGQINKRKEYDTWLKQQLSIVS